MTSTPPARYGDYQSEIYAARPYAWGLALGGADGIVHVLRSLLAEADLIMAVGYLSLGELTPDALRRVTCPVASVP